MSTKIFVYALWCMAAVGLFLVSGMFSYSPFADGGRSAVRGGIYGPTHK